MDLSTNQEAVMLRLSPSIAKTTNEILHQLGGYWTYDSVHGVLARLEKRNIVVRRSKPAEWLISAAAWPVYFNEFRKGSQ
jgi:predicted transcriptional regulator